MVLSLTSCSAGMNDDAQIYAEIDADLLAIRQCLDRMEHHRRQYEFSRLSEFSRLDRIDATIIAISHRLGLPEVFSSSQSFDTPLTMVTSLPNPIDEHLYDSKSPVSFLDSISVPPLSDGSATELPTLSDDSLKAIMPLFPPLRHMLFAPCIDYSPPNNVHSPSPHQLVPYDTVLSVKQDDPLLQLWPMASLLSDWASFIHDYEAQFCHPRAQCFTLIQIHALGQPLEGFRVLEVDVNGLTEVDLVVDSICGLPMRFLKFGMSSLVTSTGEPPSPHAFSFLPTLQVLVGIDQSIGYMFVQIADEVIVPIAIDALNGMLLLFSVLVFAPGT